jgi:hypothetical protein
LLFQQRSISSPGEKEETMPITGEEARDRALHKIGELRTITEELSALLAEIPLPTPEELEAMRRREVPWTLEAYVAAIIRDADYHVDEARVLLDDYGAESRESLTEHWRQGQLFPAHFERSLRYLVEGSSGRKISPSLYEESAFDPLNAFETLVRTLVERAARGSGLVRDRR